MIPRICIHFQQTQESHAPIADKAEKASDVLLVFLRLSTGYKTVKVHEGKVTGETEIKAWKVFCGLLVTIVCLPVALPMTLIGLIPYAVSRSHKEAHSAYSSPKKPDAIAEDIEEDEGQASSEDIKRLLALIKKTYPNLKIKNSDEIVFEGEIVCPITQELWHKIPEKDLYVLPKRDKEKKIRFQCYDLEALNTFWKTVPEYCKRESNQDFDPMTNEKFTNKDLKVIKSRMSKQKTSEAESIKNSARVFEVNYSSDSDENEASSSSDENASNSSSYESASSSPYESVSNSSSDEDEPIVRTARYFFTELDSRLRALQQSNTNAYDSASRYSFAEMDSRLRDLQSNPIAFDYASLTQTLARLERLNRGVVFPRY